VPEFPEIFKSIEAGLCKFASKALGEALFEGHQGLAFPEIEPETC